jgi:uncharacterized protein RhaS with RHS repeats
VTTYSYDASQRVTYIQYGGGPNVTLSYDNGTNGYGHLTEVQWDGSTNCTGYPAYMEFYGYSTAGQVLTKGLDVTKNLTGGGCAVFSLSGSYTYDSEGKVTSVTYPTSPGVSPGSVSYSYDAMSRLIGASDAETLGTPGGCGGPPSWSGTANWASNAATARRLIEPFRA